MQEQEEQLSPLQGSQHTEEVEVEVYVLEKCKEIAYYRMV